MLRMMANAGGYDWATWLVGILRSAIAGGALSLLNTNGTALILPDSVNVTTPGGLHKYMILLGVFFVTGAMTHMAIYLSTHGAPDKLQQQLEKAAVATKEAQVAIVEAKASAPVESKP